MFEVYINVVNNAIIPENRNMLIKNNVYGCLSFCYCYDYLLFYYK